MPHDRRRASVDDDRGDHRHHHPRGDERAGGVPKHGRPSTHGREVPPVDQRQARNYATQLAELTQFIVEQYVRDLSREEVAEAALHGLYEAAGVPVPGDLHAETRRAASASEYEMRKLFARVRLSVGNPPALEGAGAIYVSLQSLTKRLDPYSGVRRGPEARIDPLDARRGFGLEVSQRG